MEKKLPVVAVCAALLVVWGIGVWLYQATHAPVADVQVMSKEESKKQAERYYRVTSVVKATLKQLNATKNELVVTLKDGSEKTVTFTAPLEVTRGVEPASIPIESVVAGTSMYITYDSEQNRALSVWISK